MANPRHADPDQRRRALELRLTRQGWADLGPPLDPGTPAGTANPVLAELLSRTRNYLARHAPRGRVGTAGAEAGLARVCWLLSAFENVYRSGQIPEEVAALFHHGPPSVEQLRAAAPEPVVTELVALVRQLRSTGALAQLRQTADDPAAGQPLGIAGPVLVHHWADGDLLIGHMLRDVKTVVRLDDLQRTARWLWQILAYAWLDTEDRYRIRSVGLYLARHGQLVTWGLECFADHLLGGAGRADRGRREFLDLARQVIAAEGARPPSEWNPGQHIECPGPALEHCPGFVGAACELAQASGPT